MNNAKQKGFTIVELVIVIAVISILAAVLIPTFSNVIERAKETVVLQESRNTYTQMSITAASTGTTVKDDIIFGKGGHYFKLTDGVLVKTTTPDNTLKSTTLNNDLKVYGNVGVYIGDISKIENEPIENTGYFNANPKRLVYIEIKATETANTRTLVIKNSDGRIVYNKTYSDGNEPKRFYFSMYYNQSETNPPAQYFEQTNEAVQEAGNATIITTEEAAKDWYTYTFTYGDVTETGFFYYE